MTLLGCDSGHAGTPRLLGGGPTRSIRRRGIGGAPAIVTLPTTTARLVRMLLFVGGPAGDAGGVMPRPARRGRMDAGMFGRSNDLEVGRLIVARVPVAMVDHFVGAQIATDGRLDHQAVREDMARLGGEGMVGASDQDIAIVPFGPAALPPATLRALPVMVVEEAQRLAYPRPSRGVVLVGEQGGFAATALANPDELLAEHDRLRTHRNPLTVRCHSPAVDAARGFIVSIIAQERHKWYLN